MIMNYVGVDVSKAHFDVWVKNKHRKYKNDNNGIKKFIQTVDKNFVIVFESTGRYQNLLHKMCHEDEIRCCLVNPANIRFFAKAIRFMAKTDKKDAKLIAMYAEHTNPRITPYKNDYQEELEKLVHWKSVLEKTFQQYRNQLECESSLSMQKLIKTTLRKTTSDIMKVENLIDELINSVEEENG